MKGYDKFTFEERKIYEELSKFNLQIFILSRILTNDKHKQKLIISANNKPQIIQKL